MDFNSKNGMLTWVWGPVLWYLLHYISFNYPDNPTHVQKINYRKFILSLEKVLPCGKCRENFHKNISEHPFTTKDLENSNKFAFWMYQFHNVINENTKESSYTSPTFEETRRIYQNTTNANVSIKIVQKKTHPSLNCPIDSLSFEVSRNILNICKGKSRTKDGFSLIFWFVALCIAFNYPADPSNIQKKQYHDFFKCCTCIFNKNTQLIYTDCLSFMSHEAFINRDIFSTCVVKMLNYYSTRLGYVGQLDFSYLQSLFEMFRAKCPTKNSVKKESGCTQVYPGKNKCRSIVLVHTQKYNCKHILDSLFINDECFEN